MTSRYKKKRLKLRLKKQHDLIKLKKVEKAFDRKPPIRPAHPGLFGSVTKTFYD